MMNATIKGHVKTQWRWLKLACIEAIRKGKDSLDLEKDEALSDKVYKLDHGRSTFLKWLCNNSVTSYQDCGVFEILFSIEYAESFNDWIDSL